MSTAAPHAGADAAAMTLEIVLPTETLFSRAVAKVLAEGGEGAFGLLPAHIDFVTALVPGILGWTLPDGTEQFAAVDGGILVKCGRTVSVSVSQAVIGPDLGRLRELVANEFSVLDERERAARSAVAKLEASLVRRFLQIGD